MHPTTYTLKGLAVKCHLRQLKALIMMSDPDVEVVLEDVWDRKTAAANSSSFEAAASVRRLASEAGDAAAFPNGWLASMVAC